MRYLQTSDLDKLYSFQEKGLISPAKLGDSGATSEGCQPCSSVLPGVGRQAVVVAAARLVDEPVGGEDRETLAAGRDCSVGVG